MGGGAKWLPWWVFEEEAMLALVHNLGLLQWITPFLLFPLLPAEDRWTQMFRVVVMEATARCLRPLL